VELTRSLTPRFPEWIPNNLQLGAGWANFQCAFAWLKSDASYQETLATPAPAFPGSSAFGGGVVLADGRVYCIPYYTTTVSSRNRARIYNPATDTLTTPAGVFDNGYYAGGVRLEDGRVYIIPRNTVATAYLYDPTADTLTAASGVFPTANYSFCGGVLLSDRRVFCVPDNSATARIYDPATDTLSIPGGDYFNSVGATSGNDRRCTGVLLPDGRVFCVPRSFASSARIYDPVSDTVSTPAASYTTDLSGGLNHGVLLPDGRVACITRMGAEVVVYDLANDTAAVKSSGAGYLFTAYVACVLLPDGRVFFVPTAGAAGKIYDPATDAFTYPVGSYGTSSFSDGALLRDGRVFCVPLSSTTARIFGASHVTNPIDMNLVLSPYYNKR
jgi:hypothetical protein